MSYANDMIFYELSKVGNNPLFVSFGFTAHDLSTKNFSENYCGEFKAVKNFVDSNFLCFGIEDTGVSNGVVAKVIIDPKANYFVSGNKIVVENAEKILLVMKTFCNKPLDKGFVFAKEQINNMRNVSYERCFKDHLAVYKKLWSKCELSISSEKDNANESILHAFSDDSTLIYEKMFYFAKYMNIINGENNFASMLTTGLFSYHYANSDAFADVACTLPALNSSKLQMGMDENYRLMLNYFKTYEDDLKKNAGRIYKSKGYMIPFKFAYQSALPSSTLAKDVSVVLSGAVIGNCMYEYFQYTQDIKYLKTVAIPFMKELVNFYIEYFSKEGGDSVVSCPSFSPYGVAKYYEKKPIGVYKSCTADFVTVRALVQNVILACSNYSIALPEIVEYQNFLNKIPAPKTEGGAIAEYTTDENSHKSGGFMQLYPVFGSREIFAKSSPARISAYLNSVVQKIGHGVFAQTILSLGRLAEISALLGQGEACFNILRYMISNFLSKNLFFMNYDVNNMSSYVGGSNYFNLSGNQLLASALMSCIVSENNSSVSILPARPVAWKSGKLEGVSTKKAVVVDVEWDDKKGTAVVRMKANKTANFNVALFAGVKKVKGYTIDPANPMIENVSLSHGKSLVLEIKY